MHWYDPKVFSHIATSPQACLFLLHSSVSVEINHGSKLVDKSVSVHGINELESSEDVEILYELKRRS